MRFLVFDLDGTLFDTRADIAATVNAALASCGLPSAPREAIVSFVGDGVGRLVDRTVQAVGGDLELAPRVAAALLVHYRAHPVVQTRPYPGVAALLDGERERPLGLVSNKPGDLCEAILDHFGWRERFEVVLGGDWGGPRKPAPDPLLAVADRLGRPPGHGVMVGDSVADIRAGRAAGMRTVAALYGYRPPEELRAAEPDATIRRPSELPAAVAGLTPREGAK